MPGLTLWKDQEIDRMRRDMERLFARLWDDFGMPRFPRIARNIPAIDLFESGENLIIRAEIPGINPEDLDISVTEDRMHIKGEMKQESVDESDTYHRVERRYGSFSRDIQLPCRVMKEEVEATYKEGILTIVMPKCKPEPARPFKITVR
ncbi:MAG: Hsp20/alpha crystallin family protein [Deltaproteobacteria bacterium]|mgnify:CR=1 FL=1|nr:Hsp20/alpha crystallin family protein [Deltaproteobacteria bacterium]